jgi:division protein CdvB (Snf7/Vps24/ESCRT-III family)
MEKGGIMMTKGLRLAFVAADVALIAVLVISVIYLQDGMNRDRSALEQAYARRDELVSQQQRLVASIEELNNTLQAAISQNGALNAELNQSAQNPTVPQYVAPAAPPTQPSQPAVAPTRVVTRAS